MSDEVVLVGDLHFGVKDSDKIFMDSQFLFMEQLVEDCKSRGIEQVFILGDLIDSRHTVNVMTMNRLRNFFLSHENDRVVFNLILGNHDLYYRTTTEVNSANLLGDLKNLVVYDKPIVVSMSGDPWDKQAYVLLVPWVTDYEVFRNTTMKFANPSDPNFANRVFGHFDVQGMKMDNYNVSETGFGKSELLSAWEYIYSGHYHKRSEYVSDGRRLMYIGDPFQLTRAEIEDKGYLILNYRTEEVEFVKNKHCIEYKSLCYPELPDDRDEFVRGNIVDVNVSWEDSTHMTKVDEYISNLESHQPAYPIHTNFLEHREKASTEQIDASKITILGLAKKYIESSEDIHDKKKVLKAFTDLYAKYSPK